MALALKLETLLTQGTLRKAAELAKLWAVSRARVCQILLLMQTSIYSNRARQVSGCADLFGQ